MATTGLVVFDQTVQQTNEWLGAIADELETDDRHRAYLALRGTLHALRDYLVPDEAGHLAAQLPMLVRGFYYEGWDPSRTPTRDERGREDFLKRVRAPFRPPNRNVTDEIDPEVAARAALAVLGRKVSEGEAAEVRRLMPEEVRDLWPISVA